MLGHALMAMLLGVHDEAFNDLDAENAPKRYLDLVDSEDYSKRPLYCPDCGSSRVQGKGLRNKSAKLRWQCGKCGVNWFTD